MLALGKTGEGAYCRIVILTCDNHYQLTNATWVHNLLWLFDGNDKVRYITTQIASVLAVATVFVGLWT